MRDIYFQSFYDHHYKVRYYLAYSMHAKRMDNWFVGVCTLISAVGFALWGVWPELMAIWALMVALSQVLLSIRPMLPYSQQIASLKYLIPEAELFIKRMEYGWNTINTLSDDEIAKKHFELTSEFQSLVYRYADDGYFPVVKSCAKIADQQTEAYFYLIYGVEKGEQSSDAS